MTPPQNDAKPRGKADYEGSAATPHSMFPKHCAMCGDDWPDNHHGLCRACGAGLPCRADTTDTVAPDPPCSGIRLRYGASR